MFGVFLFAAILIILTAFCVFGSPLVAIIVSVVLLCSWGLHEKKKGVKL